MYGMGPGSLAVSIGCSTKEAQKIIDDFYAGFPNVKKWIDETYISAKANGYVEDRWGRRRRLPDIQLPQYEVRFTDNSLNESVGFNPILGTLGIVADASSPKLDNYRNQLNAARYKKDVDNIIKRASSDGITVKNNGWFISQAERQCVNARIQGSAATMSKKAMIRVYNDETLNKLGFKLLIAVHDELIGECPIENQDLVAERLTTVMKESALPEVTTPFKCDADIAPVWYYNDYSDIVNEEYNKLTASRSKEDAFTYICNKYCECTEEQLSKMIGENS